MEPSLLDFSLKAFIDKSKDKSSIPGGGSICALNASLAASLAIMVYGLSEKDLDQNEAHKSMESLKSLGQKLANNIDKDAHAFNRALRAFSLKNDTPEERNYRANEIQAGYLEAALVPLSTMEDSLKVGKYLSFLSHFASLHALTDVAIGADLLQGAIEGCRITILLNLQSIKDRKNKESIEDKLEDIINRWEEIYIPLKETVDQRLFCG